MKLFEWLKKNLGGKLPEAEGADTAASDPAVPGHRRALYRDPRFLPKPPKKSYWEKRPKVLGRDEAARAFSPSMRARNPALRSIETDGELLDERGLPVWRTEADVAGALGLTTSRLRWLANHRYDDGVEHYIRYRLPKRAGGYRQIMAPKRELKRVQRELLRLLTGELPVSEHAHGFVAGRSIATNARPHVGAAIVVRFDLANFFGSVTFGRVRGFLIAMGYGYEVATCVALLCTEAERQPVEVGDRICHVPVGHRFCAQGAPTSPSICNALVMRLDRRLAGLAAANGFAYTRYADDMTFSGDDPSKTGMLMRAVADITGDEGFELNRKKTRVMRRGRRQQVTGVIVNDTMGLSRKERRELRAALHQGRDDAHVRGKLAYLRMINPAQADALRPKTT